MFLCPASFARAALLLLLTGGSTAQDLLHEHRKGTQPVALGDVDGDGVADFAMTVSGTWRGKVCVISGASQLVLRTFIGDALANPLGTCLANIGDVDQDGIADLAVGALNAVRVFSIGTGQALYTIQGLSSDRFGYALAGAGDVDGDGRADFAVGAPQILVTGGGDVYHIYVAGPGFVQIRSGLDGSVLRTLTGPANQSGFGGSIANGGKLDGDAVDDLLVSHFLEPFLPYIGLSAQAFSGASGAPFLQTPIADYVGAVLAPLGDVDADGIDDFVAGEPWRDVRAVSGRTGATLYRQTGLRNSDRFGAAVSRIGDIDGDGFPDLAVGARQSLQYSPFGSYSPGPGYVRLLSGRTGSVLQTLVGNFENQEFGAQVAELGDVDGDGKAEFLIATRYDGRNYPSVRVYSGRLGFSTPTNYCVGDFNSAFTRASIGYQGSASLSANQLTLTLAAAVPGQLGVLYCGPAPASRHFGLLPDYPGYLCVGAPLSRLTSPTLISGAGALQVPVDLGPASPFALGATWYFQFAYFGNPAHPNSSDALAVTFTP